MRTVHAKSRLTLEQLADFKLPTGRTVNQNEAYRELFDFRSSFIHVLAALQETGRAAQRADGSWRLWDLYRVIKEIGRHHSVTIPGKPELNAHTNRFPDLHWLPDLEEVLWERTEEARGLRERLSGARYLRHIRDKLTRQWRLETEEEGRHRLLRLRRVGLARLRELADSLPTDREYWKKSLVTMATTAIELRRSGFGNSSRLCSAQLLAATSLGEMRLGLTYRQLRTLVGHSPRDFEAPALTQASPWPEQRGLDLTLDAIVADLPHFNASLGGRFQVDELQAEQMLSFFDEVGLTEWAVEFSLVTWHDDHYWASSLDRRVALSFGRIRTLTTLLEEAILSFAQRVRHDTFADMVESRPTMWPRLVAYLSGPDGQGSLVDRRTVQHIYQRSGAAGIHPPIDPARLRGVFNALGLVPGDAPIPHRAHAPEALLTTMVCLRNLASHRFPLVSDGDRAEWFTVWEEHIKSINRSVLWSALTLWAVSIQFRPR
jgi:hypothetical protein